MGTPTELGTSGFWGLILEPGKRYSKLVDVPFHITAAVLDTISSGNEEDEFVAVMLEVDGMEIIICNLSLKKGILQMPLNLKFEEGSRIAFYSSGVSTSVHLSGNILGNKEDYSALAMKTSGTFTQKKRKRSNEDVKSLKKIKSKELSEVIQKVVPVKKKEVVADEEEEDEDSEEDDDGSEVEDESEEDNEEEEEGEESDDEGESSDDEEMEVNGTEEVEALEISDKLSNKAKSKKAKRSLDKPVLTPKKEVDKMTPTPKKEMDKTTLTPKKEVEKTTLTPKKEVEKTVLTPKKMKPQQGEVVNGKSQKQKNTENNNAKASPQTPGKSPKIVKAGGVTCEDLVVGSGIEAKHGKNVCVYYEGRLASNNKVFDKCMGGKPFKFRLGANDVIQGWNVGIAGMKVGGKRRFVCPPHLAYGKRGCPPDIPPKSALSFVVELRAVG